MNSKLPKIETKIDKVIWRLEQALAQAIIDYDLEDVELKMGQFTFTRCSPVAKSARKFREVLDECLDSNGAIQLVKLEERHIKAAEALLHLGRYQADALDVLSQILASDGDASLSEFDLETRLTHLQERVLNAMYACSEAIAKMNSEEQEESLSPLRLSCDCEKGLLYFTDENNHRQYTDQTCKC